MIIFIIPKKEGTLRSIMEFINLNQKMAINSYPLPRIGDNMNKMEVFQ